MIMGMMTVTRTTIKTIIMMTKMIMRTITNFQFLPTVIIAMTGPIKAHTVPSSKDSQHLKVQVNSVYKIMKEGRQLLLRKETLGPMI